MEGAVALADEPNRGPEPERGAERRPLVVRAEVLPDEQEVLVTRSMEPLSEPTSEPAAAQATPAQAAEEPTAPVKRARRLWWRKRAQRPRGSSGDEG